MITSLNSALANIVDYKASQTVPYGTYTDGATTVNLYKTTIHMTNVALTNNSCTISTSIPSGGGLLSMEGRAWGIISNKSYVLPLGYNDGNSAFCAYMIVNESSITVYFKLGSETVIRDLVLILVHGM